MKKVILIILAMAFGLSLFAQPGQNIPAGSISNPRGYFDSIGPRTPAGVTPVKQDTVLHIAPFKIWNTNDTIYSIPDTVPIYSTMAAKFDSASISNDTVYFYRDNSTPLKVKLSGLIDTPTLAQVLAKGNTANRGIFIDTLGFDNNFIKENTPEASIEIWDNDTTGMISFSPQDGHIDIKAPGSENGNLIATNFTASRSWRFPDSSGTIALQDYLPVPTLRQVNGAIDLVRDYGADTTGVTNIYSALLAASATKRPIYIRKGIYNLTGLLTLPDSTYIFGDGRTSIIKLGNTNSGLRVKNVSTISGLTFKGTRNNGGASSQDAISIDSAARVLIESCFFTAVKGSAITVTRVGNATIGGYTGIMIENCLIDSCGVGIDFGLIGEYCCATNNTITNGDTGIRMIAGNCSVIGGIIAGNTWGMYLQGGSNNGHSVTSGVMINHNTNNVYCTGMSLGYLFTGCLFYSGTVQVVGSCNGVRFSNCDMSNTSFTVSASTQTAALDCRFLSLSISKDTSAVLFTTWSNGIRYQSADGATWTAIYPNLSGEATLDFPNTAAQLSADLTITVTGAVMGDVVALGVPPGSADANSSYTAWVSGADTVTVRFNNYSAGAIDPVSNTFKAKVLR